MAPPSQGPLAFFPLRKLKGNQLFKKKPAVCTFLNWRKKAPIDGMRTQRVMTPDGIEGVTKEFMVRLARAVKDAQVDMKSTVIIVAALSILSAIVHS